MLGTSPHPSVRNSRLALTFRVDQLSDSNFINELEAVLRDTGLDPRTLQLELTESIILEQAETMRDLLERIRSFGVRIALDDFGTGYSSLSYLERFPIDTLKIDQSFVRTSVNRTDGPSEIVRLIVGLGRALDMNVVAEGVEDVQQWDVLRKFGCGSAQGYLFSRPRSRARSSGSSRAPTGETAAISFLTDVLAQTRPIADSSSTAARPLRILGLPELRLPPLRLKPAKKSISRLAVAHSSASNALDTRRRQACKPRR